RLQEATSWNLSFSAEWSRWRFTRRTSRRFSSGPRSRSLADLVDMYGHRRVAISGGEAAAEALVEVLPAEIVDEESVGGLELAVFERVPDFRPSTEVV